MTDEMSWSLDDLAAIELGRAWVEAGWTWAPGQVAIRVSTGVSMLVTQMGNAALLVTSVSVAGRVPKAVLVPDMRDPGTRGHALDQVREAWGDPEMSARGGEHTGWSVHEGCDRGPGRAVADGATEAEALLAARKAAP